MSKRMALILAVGAALLLGGCSEQERREIREKEIRIAAEQAKQQRIYNEHVADLAAETRRQKNVLAAETSRQRSEDITALGRVAAFLALIGGVIAFVVFSIRRLGERHLEERTKRHAQNLKAIEGDPHLKSEHRKELYRAAVEAANRGGTPLLGYAGSDGGVS